MRGIDTTFTEDLKRELDRADKVVDYESDPVVRFLTDGYPAIERELRYRACITYPLITRATMVWLYEKELEDRTNVQYFKSDFPERLKNIAKKHGGIKFELNMARKAGKSMARKAVKSKTQVIDQVFADLQKINDEGMPENERKYVPLIFSDGKYFRFSIYGRSLFGEMYPQHKRRIDPVEAEKIVTPYFKATESVIELLAPDKGTKDIAGFKKYFNTTVNAITNTHGVEIASLYIEKLEKLANLQICPVIHQHLENILGRY